MPLLFLGEKPFAIGHNHQTVFRVELERNASCGKVKAEGAVNNSTSEITHPIRNNQRIVGDGGVAYFQGRDSQNRCLFFSALGIDGACAVARRHHPPLFFSNPKPHIRSRVEHQIPRSSINFHGNDDGTFPHFHFDGIDKMVAGDGENGGKRMLGR